MTSSQPLPRGPRLGPTLRRVIDVLVSLLVLPVVALVSAVLIVLIRLDSPGPAFFVQERFGRGGRPFKLYKLRTMVQDAEERKQDIRHLSALPSPDFKVPNDPRVTRIGRWLRSSSLDELPQFWNLLRGDITLVGPRPSSVSLAEYELWQTERLEAVPGILGKWQAEARGTASFPERCRLDISQVRTTSVGEEARFAARTVASVLLRRGAS